MSTTGPQGSPTTESSGISFDFETLSYVSSEAPSGGEQPVPGAVQLPLPLEVGSTPSEESALDAVTPPRRRLSALDLAGFWSREQRWFYSAAAIALCCTTLLTWGAATGYRELLQIRFATQSDSPDGKVRGFFGEEIYVAPDPPHAAFGGRGQLVFVLTGETTDDKDKYTGLTDTIMVCLLDFNYERVKILSIPRDTIVNYGKRWGRINEAAAIKSDITALQDTVAKFLTVPVDNVVSVNYDGFQAIIDSLGGVDVNVPKRMKYTDRAGGLNIDFEPGPQHMDGKQALEYARFRHDAEGDFGRIRRQQQLINELKQQKLNFSLVGRLPVLLPAVKAAFTTSDELSYDQLRALSLFIARLNKSDIEFATLPSYGIMYHGASVLVPRYDETRELLSRFFSNEPLNPVGPPVPDDLKDKSPL